MTTAIPLTTDRAPHLEQEHRVLLAEYGAAQTRCSTWMAQQAARIENLEAEIMRLRGMVIQRDTALAFARAKRAASVIDQTQAIKKLGIQLKPNSRAGRPRRASGARGKDLDVYAAGRLARGLRLAGLLIAGLLATGWGSETPFSAPSDSATEGVTWLRPSSAATAATSP